MKCKTFKIHLREETGSFEEAKLDKFLENLKHVQISSTLVNDEYWSVLIFYNDDFINKTQSFDNLIDASEKNLKPKPAAEKTSKSETAPAEPIVLTADEEKTYAVLREWRNENSARDGLPPYMIAHNDSLMLMSKIRPKSHDELVQIKGFGEKRAQKYGDEILQIMNKSQAGST